MRIIKPTEQQQKTLLEKFQQFLFNERSLDSKIKFEASLEQMLPEDIQKPEVHFSPTAYLKMLQLVLTTSTEIGWHGTVDRKHNIYTIKDLFVYPQQVTATTVTTDQKEYSDWLMSLNDDTFFSLRFQGHSHVNMGVTPSGTDNAFYEGILKNLEDNEFYIFLIMNKSKDINIWIHDLEQNIIFEKNDIAVKVLLEDGSLLSDWINEVKKEFIETSNIQTAWRGSHTMEEWAAMGYYQNNFLTPKEAKKDEPKQTSKVLRPNKRR